MRDFLLFTLYAPLAALGEVAVGERRVSAARPARSAILGLLAAALGIERRDEAAHAALQEGYGVAVRVETEGALLQDYHTAQVPPAKKGRRWPTRRAELAEPRLETILSLREYRADARHTVAFWTADDPPQPLAVLAEALRRPRFTLYFGRKACPPGLPGTPRIVAAETLVEAFATFDRDMPEAERALRARLELSPTNGPLYADVDAGAWLGQDHLVRRIERRRDAVVSRPRWQFGLRDELVALPARPPGNMPS
jgi:CRISPR system Cascade subunit CasD